MRRAVPLMAAVALLAGCSTGGPGGEDRSITVLAASSLTDSFERLADRFEQAHPGSSVQLSFAASSELAAQIRNGAPADVFAAANVETMDLVVAAGEAATEPVVFARNSLVVAVPAGNPGRVRGIADLSRSDLVVALCAPEVPCGAAAQSALAAAGVEPDPDTYESDARGLLSKVELGEVDAALVYRTDALQAGDAVQTLTFEDSAEAVNDYPIAVLRASRNVRLANRFVALVRSAEGRRVLAAAGFQAP